MKNKKDQILKDSFKNILITSKSKQDLIESDKGKDFLCKIYTDFFNKQYFRRFGVHTSFGANLAERLNRTIRDLLKKLVFLEGDGNWVHILPTKTKE